MYVHFILGPLALPSRAGVPGEPPQPPGKPWSSRFNGKCPTTELSSQLPCRPSKKQIQAFPKVGLTHLAQGPGTLCTMVVAWTSIPALRRLRPENSSRSSLAICPI